MATYELQKFNSPEMLEPEYRRKEAGCFVRVTTGFILVFLALILVAGVAAIVYFVQKDNLQTTKDDPQVTSVSAEKLKSDCEALAESGKLDQNKVCKYTQKKNSTIITVPFLRLVLLNKRLCHQYVANQIFNYDMFWS